jgi:P4 family phage/plasmid primase-like protien
MKEGSHVKTRPDRPWTPSENGEGAQQRNRQDAGTDWRRGRAQGDTSQGTNNAFDDSEIRRIHGAPYEVGIKGGISVNERYFVARFTAEHMVLHELKENEFYFYNSANGAWEHRTSAEVREMFAQDWQRIATDYAENRLLSRRTNRLLESLVSQLRGLAGKKDVFKPGGRVVHFANGMLHIEPHETKLLPFSPDYCSRNVCPFPWESGAQCPRFLDVLIRSALPDYDIDLLQRMLGSHLLGHNSAQRFLLLTGTAGGGKSTLVTVLESIVGPDNVVQLRTHLLNERFELARMIGKTTLTGKDVPANFLETTGAQVLKSLVGGDMHSPELKYSNAKNLRIHGHFNVIVTANSRLRFRLEGDDDAWARRTVLIPYERSKPKVRIVDFARKLIKEEGHGICRRLVEGAQRYLKECDQFGDVQLNDIQQERIASLINESNSLRSFVKSEICRHRGGTLTTDEIVRAYIISCQRLGWQPLQMKNVERALPDLMMDAFQAPLRHDVERFGKAKRGYVNVALADDDENPE